jgi:hypothetical protein
MLYKKPATKLSKISSMIGLHTYYQESAASMHGFVIDKLSENAFSKGASSGTAARTKANVVLSRAHVAHADMKKQGADSLKAPPVWKQGKPKSSKADVEALARHKKHARNVFNNGDEGAEEFTLMQAVSHGIYMRVCNRVPEHACLCVCVIE